MVTGVVVVPVVEVVVVPGVVAPVVGGVVPVPVGVVSGFRPESPDIWQASNHHIIAPYRR